MGLAEGDDAAIVSITPTDAIVCTVDFFTPLVDDARTWGRIACANSVSDVYAMGGRPLVGLNIVGWPRDDLPMALLAEVLAGGLEVADRAGMAIVGGHTVDDREPKYGLCVIGRVDPARMLTVDAAGAGDVLVLTKPIGTGIITTAIKQDVAPAGSVDAAVESMTRLNDVAAMGVVAAGVRACTDVTGFGLLGHLHRMCRASGVSAAVDSSAVPLLPGSRELAADGRVPGGTKRNVSALERWVHWDGIDEVTRTLLCDAQTSGGLLAACPPSAVDALVSSLSGELCAAVVGRITEGEPGRITVS